MEFSKIGVEKTLLRGSFILLIAFGLYNFTNFVFQLIMARMLTIEDYGTLATIFSMIYVLSIFTESVQIIVTKYTSQSSNDSQIKNILRKSLRKSAIVSVISFLVFLIISFPLSYLFKIEYLLLSISGLVIFSAFLLPVTRGILQGKKKFTSLGINMFSESIARLFFAIILVYFGFRVYGAVVASILAFLVAFLISLFSLREIRKYKESAAHTEGIYEYAKPAFVATLITVLFYSMDILIARIIFEPEISGMYSIASILSKAIFWGTHPISRAMFPLSVKNGDNKGKNRNVLVNSFIMLGALIIVALVLFYFFPDLIINVFSGKQISESSSILFLLGVGMSFLSLSNLILLYRLSRQSIKRYYLLFIFLIIELISLFYFSTNLVEFSMAFTISSFIFLIGTIFLIDN